MEREVLLKQLGERIRQIRNGKGISQAKLGAIIDKDQQAIQRIEAGRVNPTYYHLYLIAKGLEVALEEIIKEK
jgi:putative transcriptional regulator